jgi:hypothetical protein
MRKFTLATAAAVALAVTACGGDSTATPFSTVNGSGSGSGSGSGGGSTTYSMGNGSGSGFQAGVIGISSASVSAGGTTSLLVSIVDKTGALYTAAATNVTFSSPCLAQGLAAVTASGTSTAGTSANSVSTTTGIADATYTAKGCSGPDVMTASATVASQSVSASGTVTVASATIGSIKFISATPATVGLKGTGIGSTSTVIFEVQDSSGGPVPGATVTFALNTSVGGLSLAPASAVSGANGQVQTVVSAGTVHTTVRVTASIASPAVSTQSSILTVSTAIPTTAQFTIAVGAPMTYSGPACPNLDSYGFQGVQVPITATMSDRYNNPVPDGTSVTFYADGGVVGPSCTTPLSAPGDGRCMVLWASSGISTSTLGPPFITPPVKANGRTGILATTIGEDAFQDLSATGFYQLGDPFQDFGEPSLDENENGKYDLGEYFLDFNKNGVRDGPTGTFVGITCTGILPSSTCVTSTLAIGAPLLLIESTSGASVSLVSPTPPIHFPLGVAGAITFNVQDLNGNPIAAGSTIAISADSGIGVINALTASFTEGCSTNLGGDDYTTYLNTIATLTPPATMASGNVYVQVTSPRSATKSPVFVIPIQVP